MLSRFTVLHLACFPAFFLAFLSAGAVLLQAQDAARVPRMRVPVRRPVDPGKEKVLAGNTRSEANAANDLGKVADDRPLEHMLLQLRRTAVREEALQNFMAEQQDPASPNYHKWLSAAEFGRLYGPEPQDVHRVSAWLAAGGFAVNTVYPSGMLIDFSGTAGQVAAAFGTEIHNLSANGVRHIANMSDPKIPASLGDAVMGVISLHDFRPRAMHRPRAQYTSTYGGYTVHTLAPADLATIYNLAPAFTAGYTGQGQTIALLEDSDLYDVRDWTNFRQVFGLAGYTSGSFTTINPAPPSGPSNCLDPGATGNDVEATLDAEWASAAAPNAAIQLVTCADTSTTFGVLLAAENLINSPHPPPIVSISYGECEAGSGEAANLAYHLISQQAAAEGVSVFAASGDAGAATCDAGYPAATHGIGVSNIAASPYVVAVGGTDFADMYQGTETRYWNRFNTANYGSATSYIPEIPWNDSCASALVAGYSGFDTGYGADGYCASSVAQFNYSLVVSAGGGGPSGCATGVPSRNFVVSGTCQGFEKPSWQTGVAGIPNDGVRDLPDVSLFAATGVWGHYYVTCFSDFLNGGSPCTGAPVNWFGGGGTSYAAPVMAGIQALVNQKVGSSQGNPAGVYYRLAAGAASSSIFHRITTGDIAVNCSGTIDCYGTAFEARGRSSPTTYFVGNGVLSLDSQSYSPAFSADGAWNFATGLGSVDAYQLILNWPKAQ